MGKSIVIGNADFSANALGQVVLGTSELFYKNYTDGDVVSATPLSVRVGGLHGIVVLDADLTGKRLTEVGVYINNSPVIPFEIYKRNINTGNKVLLGRFSTSEYTVAGEYKVAVGAMLFEAGDYVELNTPSDSLGASAKFSPILNLRTGGECYFIGTANESGPLTESEEETNKVLYSLYTLVE